jgi:hypothetical protein
MANGEKTLALLPSLFPLVLRGGRWESTCGISEGDDRDLMSLAVERLSRGAMHGGARSSAPAANSPNGAVVLQRHY